MNRLAAVALPAIAALLVAACGSNTPTSPPSVDASATTPSPPGATVLPTAAPATPTAAPLPIETPSPPGASAPTPAARLTVTSSSFRAGGAMPARFTCDGTDVSPQLAWSGVPAGTASLALLVDDPDAGAIVHWIAYSIAPATTRLAEGAGAADSQLAQGTNDFGRVGYGGPCPPSGTHHYRFTLYALAAPLGLAGSPRAPAVRSALATATILGKAVLTATYRR
jgi:Raf kinase inhibitor-like YbhB/YbcL family protein